MARGDLQDFTQRLRDALPLRWFGDDTPVLNGVLQGLASAWVCTWQNLQFVIAQSRITTAGGECLDAIATDFFAGRLARRGSETDAAFRTRILSQLLQPRATRAALTTLLAREAGASPQLFEPTNIRDTGGCGANGGNNGLFYGASGATGGVAASAQAGGCGGYANAGLIYQILVSTPLPASIDADALRGEAAAVMPCTGIAWLHIQ